MSKPVEGRQETVLIVEDDATLRLGLIKTLRSAGFKVEAAVDGAAGLERALAIRPDLVLLDVMMPKMNGFEVVEEIRRVDADVPVLMLTAKGEEHDKVRGLRLGADDYVVKPFGVSELLARVDAALRRRRRAENEAVELVFGRIKVDFRSHQLFADGAPIEMTALEMRLLRFLVKHEGALLPRQRILDGVWGSDYFGTERTVDNFINRLRAKIEPDPKNPTYLVTVRGAGYRFARDGSAETER
jgi:DNA-binding response OmpR family regulator